MKLIYAFLSCIVAIVVCSPIEFPPETPNVGIIHGKTVPISDYPYMVAIMRYKEIWGSGVILNENYVLTTAYNAAIYQILDLRVGSKHWASGGQTVKVENVTVHPKYAGSWQYNVAVLKTSAPLKLNDKVKAIEVGTNKLTAGTKGYVAGWGKPKATVANSPLLRAAQNTVMDNKSCNTTYGESYSPSLFCAELSETGPCLLDWGSPLVVDDHVYGLYGGGWNCSTWPRVYTNVPKLAKWIQKAIKS